MSPTPPPSRPFEPPVAPARSFAKAKKGWSLPPVTPVNVTVSVSVVLLLMAAVMFYAMNKKSSKDLPPDPVLASASQKQVAPAAPAAATEASAAPKPAEVKDDAKLDALDPKELPAPATLAEANQQIAVLQQKVTSLTKDMEALLEVIRGLEAKVAAGGAAAKPAAASSGSSKAKQAAPKSAVPIGMEPVQQESTILAVVQIDDTKVVLQTPRGLHTVFNGADMPSGGKFLGFDAAARLMRTSQGDFLIR